MYVCLVLYLCSGQKILGTNSANAVSDKRGGTASPGHCLHRCLLTRPHTLPTLCLPAALTRLAFPQVVEITWSLPWRSLRFLSLLRDPTELSFPRRCPARLPPQARRFLLAQRLLPSSLYLLRWHGALCFSSALGFYKSYLHYSFRQMN